ncbi:hypothetical protein BJ165DRAFT_1484467 [Panaeolus papilionaceus]|nr:hypothetical protein BJ165DRAFT_1484467 [Panaeolus papilionaceus]
MTPPFLSPMFPTFGVCISVVIFPSSPSSPLFNVLVHSPCIYKHAFPSLPHSLFLLLEYFICSVILFKHLLLC